MSQALIFQVLIILAGTLGVTQIGKLLVARLAGVKLDASTKQALAVVGGVIVSAMTGNPLTEILPGGEYTDGALLGGLSTLIYNLINPKPKKKKAKKNG